MAMTQGRKPEDTAKNECTAQKQEVVTRSKRLGEARLESEGLRSCKQVN